METKTVPQHLPISGSVPTGNIHEWPSQQIVRCKKELVDLLLAKKIVDFPWNAGKWTDRLRFTADGPRLAVQHLADDENPRSTRVVTRLHSFDEAISLLQAENGPEVRVSERCRLVQLEEKERRERAAETAMEARKQVMRDRWAQMLPLQRALWLVAVRRTPLTAVTNAVMNEASIKSLIAERELGLLSLLQTAMLDVAGDAPDEIFALPDFGVA